MPKPLHNAAASSLPHWFAVLLASATFPLIFVGGLVTSYDAGMAVPDWPGTYGYNLLLYPWQTWFFGPWDLFIEHGHRMLGALTGMLAIALAVVTWLRDRRSWLRWCTIAAIGLVVAQGLLGGARVLMDERLVALVHGCVGPLFFAYTACLVVFTSRYWRETTSRADAAGERITRLACLTVALAFTQLAVGAVLRHVPVAASPNIFRIAVWFHLILATALTVQIFTLDFRVLSNIPRGEGLRWPAMLLAALIVVQLSLGMSSWVVKYAWPGWFSGYSFAAGYVVQEKSLLQSIVTTAHVAGGSLILFMATFLSVRTARRYPLPRFNVQGCSSNLLRSAA